MTGKTVPELTPLSAPAEDSDVLAIYRLPGPLRRTTAIAFADYTVQSAKAYAPSGSGAVDRTVQERLQDVVSAKDYAVADGVTNDGPALQTAIDDLSSGTIVFPAGRYAWDILNLKSNVSLVAEPGAVFVSLNSTATSGDGLDGFINVKNASNVVISGPTLDPEVSGRLAIKIISSTGVDVCGVAADGLLSGTGEILGFSIYVAGSDDVHVERCKITNFLNGVYCARSNQTTGTDCGTVYVDGCIISQTNHGVARQYPTGVYGYFIDKLIVTNSTFSNIKPSAPDALHTGYGVYEGDGTCNLMLVQGCRFFDDDGQTTLRSRAVFSSQSLRTVVNDNYIKGPFDFGMFLRGIQVDCKVNTVDSTRIGIQIGAFDATSPLEFAVIGNTVLDAAETGIVIGHDNLIKVQSADLKGNTVKRAQKAGIWIRSADYASVVGNTVVDCNLAEGATRDVDTGITWFGSTAGFADGNTIINTAAGKLNYGIGCSTATNTILITPTNLTRGMLLGSVVNALTTAPAGTDWGPGQVWPLWDATSGARMSFYNAGTAGAPLWLDGPRIGSPENRTAAQIGDIGNVVNTTNKFTGKIIIDTTNNRLMYASASSAAAPWWVADGSASITPA